MGLGGIDGGLDGQNRSARLVCAGIDLGRTYVDRRRLQMAEINIRLESTDRDSLEAVRAAVDHLIAHAGESNTPRAVVQPPDAAPSPQLNEEELAQAYVEDLWGRTGDGMHELLSVMASFEDRFSLADIAE